MLSVDRPPDLQPHIGSELGTSDWLLITEEMIQAFARLTGDTHWIHTDPERVRRETPFDGIIAHGFLTLSLVTRLMQGCYEVREAKRWINYGLERARFTNIVKPGTRLRLRAKLNALTAMDESATRIALGCTLEIEGEEKPALIVDLIVIAFA